MVNAQMEVKPDTPIKAKARRITADELFGGEPLDQVLVDIGDYMSGQVTLCVAESEVPRLIQQLLGGMIETAKRELANLGIVEPVAS